jgi:type IV pilus assembly protein PilA
MMVVVLIIAILIAVALPTFLSARQRAQDRQAQATLRNALTAEKTYYADALTFTASAGEISSVQGYLIWVNAAPADARLSQVAVGTAGSGNTVRVWMESLSGSNDDFCISEVANQGTFYKASAGCFADPTLSPLTSGWRTGGF